LSRHSKHQNKSRKNKMTNDIYKVMKILSR